VQKARGIYSDLKTRINGFVLLDERGNIGKRYLSQDEIGTPFCITVDFQTLEDNTVTVRARDSAKQERVEVSGLSAHLQKKLT
jgi:glycyl-tRNA synthetase